MIETALFHPLAMLGYGLAAHGATVMGELWAAGERIHPCRAVREHPWRTALTILGALAGYGALHATGQINPVLALTLGYMGSDVFKRLSAGAGRRLENVT